jgi:hypothetical protein
MPGFSIVCAAFVEFAIVAIGFATQIRIEKELAEHRLIALFEIRL